MSGVGRLAERLDPLIRRLAPEGTARHRLARKAAERLRRGERRRLAKAAAAPEITLLLPIDSAAPGLVLETVQSIRVQTADRWELLVIGDATIEDRDLFEDPRIRRLGATGDRAEALNAGAADARAGLVAALDPGDWLVPTALAVVLGEARQIDADVLYCDETAAPEMGPPGQPFLKPDWSPELALAFPYIGRLCVMKRPLVAELGGWRSRSAAADEYAIVLAAARAGRRIRRIPGALYIRRLPLTDHLSTPAAVEARRAALDEHIAGAGLAAAVAPDPGPGRLRVRRPLDRRPVVSILIAMRDRLPLIVQCTTSIERLTSYSSYEIVIIDNGSQEAATLEYLERTPHRVVRAPGPFNFSAINNAGARAARGEYLLFLNNDTEVVDGGWLEAMLEWAQQPDIGCVGAQLLFGDGRLQHVGVTLHDGSAFHPGYGERPGAQNWLDVEVVRNYSAVTAACLMMRRSVFEEVGGFDETFPVAYNDVDLCVRVGRRGYRHVYTPYARLYHHESSSRPPGVTIRENDHLRSAVGSLLWNDPYAGAQPAVRVTPRSMPPMIGRLSRLARRGRDVASAVRWRRESLRGAEEISSEPPGSDAIRWLDRVEVAQQARIGLFMHPAASRTYRVQVSQGGRFVAWLALMPEVWDRNRGGVRFTVTVEVEGRSPRTRSWTIDPQGSVRHRAWRRVTVRLPRTESGVTLTLRTSLPRGAAPASAWAVWGDPLLLTPKPLGAIVRRQLDLVRSTGLRGALRWYARLLRGAPIDHAVYESWLRQHRRPAADAGVTEQEIAALPWRPRISVVTPVYNTHPQWLRACVQSTMDQTYPDWEHCLADDGSTNPATVEALRELETSDPRVKVVHLAANGGISAASNAALALATGEFVALLDHDDELTSDALLEIVRLLNDTPDADLIYTDEDKLELDGTHAEPFFKPDWSPEYLHSTMYIGHLAVYRRSLIESIGGFRSAYDGSQDYDLALRATAGTDRVHHIPRVLYHWRKVPGSAAGVTDAKPWGLSAARRALEDFSRTLPVPATVEDQPGNGFWRLHFQIVGDPLVSVMIPTDGRIAKTSRGERDLLLECLRSIVSRTTYRNYELLVADNGRLSPQVLAFLRDVPHRRLVYTSDGPFNFAAKVNFVARHAKGDHLLLLNDDTEVLTPEWMSALLEFSQQPAIGAVGGKLFYPDGRLQHVGVVLGIGGGACHVLAGQPGRSPGYFGSALVIRNYSAVTGACCMTRRAVFEELGGFDEHFAVDFNDVDYCLRAGAHGYRTVATPFAQMYHFEGSTFGSRQHVVNPAEVDRLSAQWGHIIAADPFYNPNLTLSGLDYSLRL